jgi:hypothetical protein
VACALDSEICEARTALTDPDPSPVVFRWRGASFARDYLHRAGGAIASLMIRARPKSPAQRRLHFVLARSPQRIGLICRRTPTCPGKCPELSNSEG